MKILITGYKGFIGKNMLRYLTNNTNHEVTTYEWGEDKPNIEGLDCVMHFGALTSATETDVDKLMRQNFDFSCWLLNECAKYGVNLQFSSTAEVYGFNTEFREDSPVDPKTPYAWSKYMFERYVSLVKPKYANKFNIQIFRYFDVYGAGEDHKGKDASPYYQYEKQARENGKIKVYKGTDKYQRDFVHIDSVINVHLEFLRKDVSGTFNVGSGVATNFIDIAKKFDVPIEEISMPQELKNSYQKYTCADLTLLNKTLEQQ